MSDIANECRICFETEKPDDPFIQPCACKGTSKYIHESCLNTWRKTAENREARKRCMECGDKYIIAKLYPLEKNPFTDSLMLNKSLCKSVRNNLSIGLFGSILLCWVDSPTQASLTVFSFGNNWYNYTFGSAIKSGNAAITIPYYLSLASFIQNVYIFFFFYFKIYTNIKRYREFLDYIKYELLFLNLTIINFLVIFWGCHEIGTHPFGFYIVLVFMMTGAGFNYAIPPSLTVVTNSSIKYLNEKKNPETVLNVTHNPLNTVIEMLPTNMLSNDLLLDQQYEELATESEESEEAGEFKSDIV